MAIRIVVADDERLLRETLEHILASDPEIEVVGSASNGKEALLLCLKHGPDIALLDISMPHADGLTAAALIRERLPDTKVIMLTMHDELGRVRQALQAGVDAYVLKDASPREVIQIVKAVHRGEEPIESPHLADRRFLRERGEARALLDERQLRLVDLVCRGESNAEIARELLVSGQTVKRDLAQVFEVLGVDNRTQLAVRAMELGLGGGARGPAGEETPPAASPTGARGRGGRRRPTSAASGRS